VAARLLDLKGVWALLDGAGRRGHARAGAPHRSDGRVAEALRGHIADVLRAGRGSA